MALGPRYHIVYDLCLGPKTLVFQSLDPFGLCRTRELSKIYPRDQLAREARGEPKGKDLKTQMAEGLAFL